MEKINIILGILNKIFEHEGYQQIITEAQINEDLMNLGMDSIMFIRIVVGIEEELDCEIPDDKLIMLEMNTIAKILSVLETIEK